MHTRKFGQPFLGQSELQTHLADSLAKHIFRVICHTPNIGDLTTIRLETISIITMSFGLGDLGFFSQRLLHSMAGLKLSSKKLAPRLGCSYEYVRRMTRSESLPSPRLLTKMCSVFHWKAREIEKLVRLDDCRRKFGPRFWTVQGINPRMEVVYILFPYLTPDQRQMFVNTLRAYLVARDGCRQETKNT